MVPSWFVNHKKARIGIKYCESFDEHDTKKRTCYISLTCTLKIRQVQIAANYTCDCCEPRSVPTKEELPVLLSFESVYCQEDNRYYVPFFVDGHLYYSKHFQYHDGSYLISNLIDKMKIPSSSLFKKVF